MIKYINVGVFCLGWVGCLEKKTLLRYPGSSELERYCTYYGVAGIVSLPLYRNFNQRSCDFCS